MASVTALRALLGDVVDYAGLFPPAALDMKSVVENYARYRASDDAWMLGRLVVPAARLGEITTVCASLDSRPVAWHISALLGDDVARDIAAILAFNRVRREELLVDSVEGRFGAAPAIAAAARLLDPPPAVFVELPTEPDPAAAISALAGHRFGAKIRTGGTTAGAFPSPALVLRFMGRCRDARVAFKATAGLHHPLRAEYPLTYEPNSVRGVMFGYLNVFLTAAFLRAGLMESEAVRLLEERDPTSLTTDEQGVRWRGHALAPQQLRDARSFATSFGSCSFREPVDQLRALGLIA